MIKIKNQIIKRIDEFTVDGHDGESEGMTLEHCLIHELDVTAVRFSGRVTICNCIIDKLGIHSTVFGEGLMFTGNIVMSDIDYQMGGHNNDEMIISDNVFHGFFSFFDCIFEKQLTVKNNIFKKGTDLLTRENKGFDNCFYGGVVLSGNIGQLNIWPTTVN